MDDDLSTLINGLLDPSAARRLDAAARLARLGPAAQAAVVPLVRAAGDPREDIRQWATAALEEVGPPAPDDGAALAELLGDPAADVGFWAATLLGRLASKKFVEPLVRAVGDPSPLVVRQRACWALGRIGPAARDAVGPLRSAAQSDDRRLARLAQTALEQIGE